MARKKIEFRPDPTGHNWADKLRLTPLQRKSVLKWLLYSAVCVAGLVLQDSMLARLRLFGGCFDVTPALIVLICVLEGAKTAPSSPCWPPWTMSSPARARATTASPC